MSVIEFKQKRLEEADASKRFYIRNFLEVMDKTVSDPVEKQIIRTQFLDVFNKHHRFLESIIVGAKSGRHKNKSRQ